MQLTASGEGVNASASLSDINFGDVATGTQVQGDAVLQNMGVGPLQLGGATVYGAGFAIAQDNCGPTLAAGASCTIKVVLDTAGITLHHGVLTVPSAELGNLHAVLAGQSRAALFTVTPSTYAFPDTQIGQVSQSLKHTVVNEGNMASTITLKPIAPFGINSSSCSGSLAAGATCSFNLTFTPTVMQPYRGAAVELVNIAGVKTLLTATGNGASQSASLTNIDFDALTAGTTKDLTSTLTNTGKGPLTVTVPTAGNSAVTGTGFSFVNTNCPMSLSVGASCGINIRYTAVGTAISSGNFRVTTGAGVQQAILKGSSAEIVVVDYSIGTGGIGGIGGVDGGLGGTTRAVIKGVSLAATGGGGGTLNYSGGNGGYGTGGLLQTTGGYGGISAQYNGGGGGGGVGGAPGASLHYAGAAGAQSIDVSGLKSAVLWLGYLWDGAGVGGVAGTGTSATGFGSGGGGGSAGNGGSGYFGGGGGGARGAGSGSGSPVMIGGAGGAGVVILQFTDLTAIALTSGTSYTVPSGKVLKNAWVVGAGGGGAGARANSNDGGGGGGAGGVAFQSF